MLWAFNFVPCIGFFSSSLSQLRVLPLHRLASLIGAAESVIWIYNLSNGTITAQWINNDKCKRTELVKEPLTTFTVTPVSQIMDDSDSSKRALVITDNITVYKTYHPSSYEVVSLMTLPLSSENKGPFHFRPSRSSHLDARLYQFVSIAL